MKNQHLLLLAFALLLGAFPAAAAPPAEVDRHALCGAETELFNVTRARHESFQRRLTRQREAGMLPEKSAPNVYQSGQIAVLENDGTLVIPPNEFDLQGRGMQYLRRPKGMSVVRTNLGFKDLIGEKVELGDDDSVLIRFPEGFEFPFGEEVYTSLWLNSDGNLTFGSPEPFSNRNVASLLTGPPRLAPLYTDLDPSSARDERGVYVSFPPNRVRITWLGVPNFGAFNLNTFQVTLFETGRATFVYGDDVHTDGAVVGASAFGNQLLHLIDYNEELPFRPPQFTAIAEEFNNDDQRDDFAITQTFFQHFQDAYTHVLIWLDFAEQLGGGAFAFHINVKNTTQGIGRPVIDQTSAYGSDGELESFIQMGSLIRYPANPDEPFLADDTTMSLVGHESGHRWMAFARILENGVPSNSLLGRQLAHWSWHMDSEGSVMEGNDWTPNGGNSYISSDRTVSRYSELDQYLMGLVGANTVPDFFYLANPNHGNAADNPQIGAVVEGTRVDVSIDDILAVLGPRVPSSATAPKTFRMAFVLVGDDQPVSQASIDQLEVIRQRWEEWFVTATDGHGQVRTALFPKQ